MLMIIEFLRNHGQELIYIQDLYTKICKFLIVISNGVNRFHLPKEDGAEFVLPSVDVAFYKLRE